MGPARVIGFDSVNRRYILEYRGTPVFVDSFHVRRWDGTPVTDDRDFFSIDGHGVGPGAANPADPSAVNMFPAPDPLFNDNFPKFQDSNPLIAPFAGRNPSLSPPEITCPKCLNRASHHAHQRWSTGCRLHDAHVTKCLNVFAVSILGGGNAVASRVGCSCRKI